jgi:hypothetical protein
MFNLLSIVLCLPLLAETETAGAAKARAAWEASWEASWEAGASAVGGSAGGWAGCAAMTAEGVIFWVYMFTGLLCLLALNSGTTFMWSYYPKTTMDGLAHGAWLRWVVGGVRCCNEWRVLHGYGVFPRNRLRHLRLTPVIEGSWDKGRSWKRYHWKYLSVHRWCVAPFQPKMDFTLWYHGNGMDLEGFAAPLGTERPHEAFSECSLISRIALRLLEGHSDCNVKDHFAALPLEACGVDGTAPGKIRIRIVEDVDAEEGGKEEEGEEDGEEEGEEEGEEADGVVVDTDTDTEEEDERKGAVGTEEGGAESKVGTSKKDKKGKKGKKGAACCSGVNEWTPEPWEGWLSCPETFHWDAFLMRLRDPAFLQAVDDFKAWATRGDVAGGELLDTLDRPIVTRPVSVYDGEAVRVVDIPVTPRDVNGFWTSDFAPTTVNRFIGTYLTWILVHALRPWPSSVTAAAAKKNKSKANKKSKTSNTAAAGEDSNLSAGNAGGGVDGGGGGGVEEERSWFELSLLAHSVLLQGKEATMRAIRMNEREPLLDVIKPPPHSHHPLLVSPPSLRTRGRFPGGDMPYLPGAYVEEQARVWRRLYPVQWAQTTRTITNLLRFDPHNTGASLPAKGAGVLQYPQLFCPHFVPAVVNLPKKKTKMKKKNE